jgi:hypothetical protein
VRWRVSVLGIVALPLLMTVGCSAAGAGAGVGGVGGDRATGSAPASLGPVPAPGASVAAASGHGASDQAEASAQARLEAVLRGAYEHAKPGSDQLRDALVAAGFPAADVEVTADRSPTGLQADAVEVGVREGDRCLVAQVRSGAVHVTALPVLADGLCLVGAPGR